MYEQHFVSRPSASCASVALHHLYGAGSSIALCNFTVLFLQAKLRRDAVTERKKASKLEVELARIQRLHQHKTLDVSSLKAALKGRDQTLEEAHNKVKQLEETLVRYTATWHYRQIISCVNLMF